MSKSRFPVLARMDLTRTSEGTVTIDRSTGVFSVRPKRRRRTYDLPLDDVATMVCQAIIIAELREKKRQKKLARTGKVG